MKVIIYPNVDVIIAFNALAITMFDVKKSDKVEMKSYSKISNAISKCKVEEGDIFDKASVLLIELIVGHPFASGNRRTAFIATLDFLKLNRAKFGITDNIQNANVLKGIREGYYSKNEIKEWIKNGKIREFKR